MRPELTLELDPAITPEVLEVAHETTPTDFLAILEAQDRDGQDDLEELGAGAVVPQTPPQALNNAQGLSVSGRFVGVGYCLRTVRQDEFRISGLYPDAETAWEEAEEKHLTTNPLEIPRGAIPFWVNGRFGHVALGAGGGMCWTTDYRRPGYVDLAPLRALGPWCRGRLVGWAEDVNAIDLWPDDPKPVDPFGIDDRIRLVKRALKRARQKGSPARRILGLKRWLDQLEARRDKLEEGGK